MKFDRGRILIALAFLLAIYLRLNDIEGKNMWFDEVYSWNTSQYDLEGIVKSAAGDIHPPFYYMVLKWWTYFTGDSVFSMRLLSVVFSILSMVFIYKISYDILKNDTQVFFVFILYALSPINIHYAQEVRMFMMNTFLCLGSVYYFLGLLENPSLQRKVLYVLFSLLAIYTHYFAFLILFTEFLVVAYRQFKNRKDLSLTKNIAPLFGVVLVLYLPWFPEFFRQVSAGQPWRVPQDLLTWSKNTFAFFKDIIFSYFVYYKAGLIYKAANGVTLLIIASYFIGMFMAFKRKLLTGKLALVTVFFIIPFAIAVIISFRNSLLLSRYISIIIPYFIISFVAFAFMLKSRKLTYVMIIPFILASMVGMKFNYEMNFKNNDYRGVISYLEENYNAGDRIVVEPHYMGWSIKYHNIRGETNLPVPDIIDYSFRGIIDSLGNAPDMKKLWFVLDYSSLGDDGYDEVTEKMEAIGFKKEEEAVFEVVPDEVRVYYFVRE